MFRAINRVTALLFLITAAAAPAWAQAQSNAAADARLRALYTDEWNWRQKEGLRGSGGDRFPRVDAASQQARLAYWTKTLAALDAIPFDQLSGHRLGPAAELASGTKQE
jgi:hypothetical protein